MTRAAAPAPVGSAAGHDPATQTTIQQLLAEIDSLRARLAGKERQPELASGPGPAALSYKAPLLSSLTAAPSSSCSASPHTGACARCKAASGGSKCETKMGWDWTASMATNEAKAVMPGLQVLRGIDGSRADGVYAVARWNQSNWPAMLHRQPARVRAASHTDRLRLCNLWKREHSYQSFPILLGCPGRSAPPPSMSQTLECARLPCALTHASPLSLRRGPRVRGALPK